MEKEPPEEPSEHTDKAAADHTDLLEEDNLTNKAEEDTDYHTTGHDITEQAVPNASHTADSSTYSEHEGKASDLTEATGSTLDDNGKSRESDKVYQTITDDQEPSQTDNVEEDNLKISGQADQKNYDPISHRLPSQDEPRPSDQMEESFSPEPEDTRHTLSEVSEERTSVQVDHRLSSPSDERLEDQTSHQDTELAEQEDGYNKANGENRADEQFDHLMYKQDGQIEDYLADDGIFFNFDYKTLNLFEDISQNKEADRKIESCIFEERPQNLSSSKVSVAIETESDSLTLLENCKPFDNKLISYLQAKDETLSQMSSLMPSTLNKNLSGQKVSEALEANLDYASQFDQEKHVHEQKVADQKKLFPQAYQDPYQLALRYMEKHNILQIFQITENLIYEKPEDPLSFILHQV
ncbi:PREDICTED: uncharacterized protein C3orf30 homolog [Elephantulus edwardii]|uniref:uncharacterized protein C3orf30 homolog n=1 Tax=Elephantulus edwardii TaxID=28737 RepID=UPI0003F063D4|nr:PREDICTED: uncharacterized protein C3orf30 homolog [Elephantulus edwardii]